MSTDQIRAEVAERMSKTIGLPSTSVNALMAEFTDQDVEQLHGLDDAAFKQESVKLVNKAQQRQFANMGQAQSDATAPPSAAPSPIQPAAPAPTEGSSERKKLIIPMAPSTSPGTPTPPTPASVPNDQSGLSAMTTPSRIMIPPDPGNSGVVVPMETRKPSIKIDLGDASAAAPAAPVAPAEPPPASPGSGRKLQINMNAAQSSAQSAADEAVPVAHAAAPAAPAPTASISVSEDQGKGRMASGIKAVEPDNAGPLSISPQEKQLLEEEVPKMVRNASLPDEGGAKEVSSAFTSKGGEQTEFLSKKNMPLLIGAGVGGLVVMCLIIYFAVTIFFPSSSTPDGSPPPKPPTNPDKGKAGSNGKDGGTDAVKGFVGKWAWKHAASFEETFENNYLLSGRQGTVFTIDMWVRVHRSNGVKSVTLSGIGDKFIIGMTTYRNKPYLVFDVPEASPGKGGIRTTMPTGSGWLHLAGVYDPVNDKTMRFYVNGKKVGSKPLRKDPPLPASIFIFRGEITGGDSYVLIDDVRMSNSVAYTENFKPERNLGYDKNTATLLRMEKKVKGAGLYEIPNEADDAKKVVRFGSGEFVEVDTQNYKLAIERSAELETLMFEYLKKKMSPKAYQEFSANWPEAPLSWKARKLNEFEELLDAQERKKKTSAPK